MVIGFFMPLPLAMMIPFMGIQSAVMAKQFGENFQYGKRRISAMSNEEFNLLTPKMIQDNANLELKAMIPSMESSVQDMRGFQEFLVKEMLKTVGDLLRSGLGFVLGIPDGDVNKRIQDLEHFIHGHFAGHPELEPVPPPEAPVEVPSETNPTIPPEEQEPPTETIISIRTTSGWLKVNAQGRIQLLPFNGITSDMRWHVQSNLQGTWTTVAGLIFPEANLPTAVQNAMVAWPSRNYTQFGLTNPVIVYFILTTKWEAAA